MPTRINTIDLLLTNPVPSAVDNLSIETISNEQRVYWGMPVDNIGMPSYLAARSMMPPRRIVTIGDTFRIVRVLFARSAVTVSADNDLRSVTLTLSADFDGTSGEADLTITHRNGVISCREFGSTITVGGRQLEVLGFEFPGAPVSSEMVAELGDIKYAYILATLVNEPTTTPSGSPVFSPKNCTVPFVPPIDDTDWLDDCNVPDEIEPIIDCPEIDLPSVAALGVQALVGDAADGDPGADGKDGCTPRITISYKQYCVRDCADTGVFIDSIQITPCWKHLHFRFYICCPYTFPPHCCLWIWCPCDDDHELPPTDSNCPKTDTCTDAPGHWALLTGTCSSDPPCIVGEYYGQVEVKCSCTAVSSSSSSSSWSSDGGDDGGGDGDGDGGGGEESYGPWSSCCPSVSLPSTLYLTAYSTVSCSHITVSDLPLTYDSDTGCWHADADHDVYISFCCMETTPGNYEFQLTAVYDSDSGCVVVASNEPDLCSPFSWSAEATVNAKDCCGSSTNKFVSITFSVSDTV